MNSEVIPSTNANQVKTTPFRAENYRNNSLAFEILFGWPSYQALWCEWERRCQKVNLRKFFFSLTNKI